MCRQKAGRRTLRCRWQTSWQQLNPPRRASQTLATSLPLYHIERPRSPLHQRFKRGRPPSLADQICMSVPTEVQTELIPADPITSEAVSTADAASDVIARVPITVGKIHQGDCIDLMQRIEAGTIDLVFADPPFNIGYE